MTIHVYPMNDEPEYDLSGRRCHCEAAPPRWPGQIILTHQQVDQSRTEEEVGPWEVLERPAGTE